MTNDEIGQAKELVTSTLQGLASIRMLVEYSDTPEILNDSDIASFVIEQADYILCHVIEYWDSLLSVAVACHSEQG